MSHTVKGLHLFLSVRRQGVLYTVYKLYIFYSVCCTMYKLYILHYNVHSKGTTFIFKCTQKRCIVYCIVYINCTIFTVYAVQCTNCTLCTTMYTVKGLHLFLSVRRQGVYKLYDLYSAQCTNCTFCTTM